MHGIPGMTSVCGSWICSRSVACEWIAIVDATYIRIQSESNNNKKKKKNTKGCVHILTFWYGPTRKRWWTYLSTRLVLPTLSFPSMTTLASMRMADMVYLCGWKEHWRERGTVVLKVAWLDGRMWFGSLIDSSAKPHLTWLTSIMSVLRVNIWG